MYWETIADILEEDFKKWCMHVRLVQTPRAMIEYLGAGNYLKIKKLATIYTEEERTPNYSHVEGHALHEGCLIPATWIEPKGKKRKKNEHIDHGQVQVHCFEERGVFPGMEHLRRAGETDSPLDRE